jgi:hypothetical protein
VAGSLGLVQRLGVELGSGCSQRVLAQLFYQTQSKWLCSLTAQSCTVPCGRLVRGQCQAGRLLLGTRHSPPPAPLQRVFAT